MLMLKITHLMHSRGSIACTYYVYVLYVKIKIETHTHSTHTHTHTHTHTVHAGLKKGFLYKKKKVDNIYQSRFFVLDANSLTYYKKITVGR